MQNGTMQNGTKMAGHQIGTILPKDKPKNGTVVPKNQTSQETERQSKSISVKGDKGINMLEERNKQDKKACQFCGKSFKDIPSLNRHISEKHQDELMESKEPMMAKMFKCSVCPESFETLNKRKVHFRKHSKAEKE